MQLNLGSGDFLLNADLSDLRTGNARLDSLLQAQGDQPFVFKGNISENILTYSQQQNDEKNYTMQGQLTVNNVTLPCTAVFDPINLADKNEIKNYRMDLAMQIDPEKFPVKIPGVRFTRQIALEITAGRLNVQN